jgi:hypothetical protein
VKIIRKVIMRKGNVVVFILLFVTLICFCNASNDNLCDMELDHIYGGGQNCSWIEGTDGCPTPTTCGCYIYDEGGPGEMCMGWVIGGICAEESKKCNGTSTWCCNPSTPDCDGEWSMTGCSFQDGVCQVNPVGTEYYDCGGTKDWCYLSPPP